MTEIRKEMMIKIMDGHPSAPAYLYHLDRFVRCDQILKWLIANKLTGQRFIDWVRVDHKGSILNAGAHVLSAIDRNTSHRPIIGNIDYLLQ